MILTNTNMLYFLYSIISITYMSILSCCFFVKNFKLTIINVMIS